MITNKQIKHAEQCRKWRLEHPGYASLKNRKYKDENISKYIFQECASRAKKTKKEFSLTLLWVEKKLAAGICEQTGIPFSLKRGHTDPINGRNKYFPSIDRIDSSFGYTETNCQMVCTIYNIAKADWTNIDVLEMAKALIKHKTVAAVGDKRPAVDPTPDFEEFQ